jgi:hypothetical protein
VVYGKIKLFTKIVDMGLFCAILKSHKQTGVNDMYNQMPCGNTQAEIKHDTETFAQEQARYAAELGLWKETRDKLLAGETIYTGCAKLTLSERLANEYQEFSDLIDLDQDIMNDYLAWKCGPAINELIKQEASVLASIIVG